MSRQQQTPNKFNSTNNRGGAGGVAVSGGVGAGGARGGVSGTVGAKSRIPTKDDDSFSNSLSKLNSSLGNVKDNTHSKSYGNCAQCKRAVIGDQIEAFGQLYHPEHFQCGKCKVVIVSQNFFEINGLPACDNCNKLSGAVCADCKKPIVGKVTTALGKSFHPGHFQCFVCKTPLDTIPFMENNGKVYCEKDFNAQFGACCVECGQPVEGECIQEDDKYWHPEHFKCGYCYKLIENGIYFNVEGKICCEIDFASHDAVELCGQCGKGITGDYLEALGRKFHPEHLQCSYCSTPLGSVEFAEDNGQAYCNECASKLFT